LFATLQTANTGTTKTGSGATTGNISGGHRRESSTDARRARAHNGIKPSKGKRRLEDQLAGRVPTVPGQETGRPFQDAIKSFITEKEIADIDKPQRDRYSTELERFATFCEAKNIFVTQRITEDVVKDYKKTRPTYYESTNTVVVRIS